MTALYMDGFDIYGQGLSGGANMLAGAWAEIQLNGGPGLPSWGSRTGLYALKSNAFGSSYRWVLPATKGRLFVSCGFSVEQLPSLDFRNSVITFCTAANAIIATLWCQSNGALVLAASDGTVLAATQGPEIVSRSWQFLEMDFNQAGGDFVLRVDDPTGSGTAAINASGLSLGSTAVGQIRVLEEGVASFGFTTAWLDDLFIRDTSGSVNNGWLGDRRVAALLPDGDTATAGWTPRYYHNIGQGILNNTPGNAAVTAASATSLNVGSGDFTLEGFVRFQALPTIGRAVIFSRWDETNNQRSYQFYLGGVAFNGGNLVFQTSTDGTNATVAEPIEYPWTPELDTWYHVALVRASGELLMFVAGQQFGLPIADASTYFAGSAPFALCAQAEGSGSSILNSSSLDGWLDETRFTVGFARYTSNFTPPTTLLPRGSPADPEWADVALLCGFDSIIQDESGFARALTARNQASQQTVNDGPDVGVWSTIGKAGPDDNTFAEAPFLAATDILTLSAQPAVNDTVTVGTTDGSTDAVYTFKAAAASAFQVLIDTTLQGTLQNLYNAINAGPGSGTKYGTGTTSNFDVIAAQLPAGQMEVTALTAGTAGNAIAAATSLTHGGGWATATLAGGLDIPGPSDFKIQRPPPSTTIISAAQITFCGLKSDAGVASVNSALVGPLGAVTSAGAHSLTVSPDYYSDMYELDPDTSAQITPATLINGAIRLNRAT